MNYIFKHIFLWCIYICVHAYDSGRWWWGTRRSGRWLEEVAGQYEWGQIVRSGKCAREHYIDTKPPLKPHEEWRVILSCASVAQLVRAKDCSSWARGKRRDFSLEAAVRHSQSVSAHSNSNPWWNPNFSPIFRVEPGLHERSCEHVRRHAMPFVLAGVAQPEKLWKKRFFGTVRIGSDWLWVARGGSRKPLRLLRARSSVRFHLKPEESNSHGFELSTQSFQQSY